MMNNIRFEVLTTDHLPAVLDIYKYYVLNTTATFHDHAVTMEDMKDLVLFDNPRYKTFVILYNDIICGYVLITQFKKREAYNGTAEVTIYLKHDYVAQGIGSQAIKFIEEFAVAKEFHVLIATICGENNDSIKVFERNGFMKCAHYREVGKKFGQLLDVVAYQKKID